MTENNDLFPRKSAMSGQGNIAADLRRQAERQELLASLFGPPGSGKATSYGALHRLATARGDE
jgi:hypothetical protein